MILPTRRLASIDTFRALTMFLMIFVNDLVLVKEVPAWLEHAGETEDRLGLADIVLPAFLFIVGLSIPFAIGGRIAKGFSRRSTLVHILQRSLALLVMGFYQVNYENYNGAGALLPKYGWLLFVTIGFFLVWLDYPAGFSKNQKRVGQGSGILLLLVMALIYRGGTTEDPEWMKPHWYGVLGLIGWCYLLCALVYLFGKDRLPVLLTVLVFFLGFAIADKAGWLHFLSQVRQYIWIVGSGTLPALTMAGVATAVYYRRRVSDGKMLQGLMVLAFLALVALGTGFALRPLGGISKIHSTPCWILICMSISLGCFILLAFLVDKEGKEKWFRVFRPAGTSALTSYLLTYLHFAVFQLIGWRLPLVLRTGDIGIVKSLVFALLIVLLTGVLEKKKMRLSI